MSDVRLINNAAYKGDWAHYKKENWWSEKDVHVRHTEDKVIVREDGWFGYTEKVYDKNIGSDINYLR